jgi:hypothetical protein
MRPCIATASASRHPLGRSDASAEWVHAPSWFSYFCLFPVFLNGTTAHCLQLHQHLENTIQDKQTFAQCMHVVGTPGSARIMVLQEPWLSSGRASGLHRWACTTRN